MVTRADDAVSTSTRSQSLLLVVRMVSPMPGMEVALRVRVTVAVGGDGRRVGTPIGETTVVLIAVIVG